MVVFTFEMLLKLYYSLSEHQDIFFGQDALDLFKACGSQLTLEHLFDFQ